MNQKANEERRIEQLLGHAGPRTPPPPETREAVRDRLHREWRRDLGRRRRARVARWALAAGVVLVAGLVTWWPRSGIEAPVGRPGATVTELSGDVRVSGLSERSLGLDGSWSPGEQIETGPDARVALRGPHGEHLRVDQQSLLKWTSDQRLRLIQGRVYVDTLGERDALSVASGAAVVRHLGTQYLVAYDGTDVELVVRSGEALLESPGADAVAARGDALRLDPAGRVHRGQVRPWGGHWDWVDALAPGFELDGRTVHEFVAWVAAETGREARYASDRAYTVSERARLRGQVTGAPLDALHAVLAASELQAVIEQGVITVSLRSTG